jgi:hypothetical protein
MHSTGAQAIVDGAEVGGVGEIFQEFSIKCKELKFKLSN